MFMTTKPGPTLSNNTHLHSLNRIKNSSNFEYTRLGERVKWFPGYMFKKTMLNVMGLFILMVSGC